MAFDIDGFGTVGPGAGQNMVHYYRTDDLAATVEAASYFNGISDILRAGDQILASLDMDGAPAIKQYLVSAISAGAVTVTA